MPCTLFLSPVFWLCQVLSPETLENFFNHIQYTEHSSLHFVFLGLGPNCVIALFWFTFPMFLVTMQSSDQNFRIFFVYPNISFCCLMSFIASILLKTKHTILFKIQDPNISKLLNIYQRGQL